jgi:outer membrane protein OmpA-like peptidoglycan-associated protein
VASPAPAAAPAPIVALPYNEAVMAAAREVLSKAELPAGQKYSVVIDPLVDGTTQMQTAATVAIEQDVVGLVKNSFPQYEIKPFSANSVAALPLVFIGTFTPINLQGKADGDRDAYRICFALADLKTGKIVSKGFARSQTGGVDHTPIPYFRDSPLWVNDKVVEGYVRTCQGTKAGDPINPAYVDKVVAATAIDEAMNAYNAKKYREALTLYNAVLRNPTGDQPRVHAGIYLTQLKLGNRNAAMQAFGKVVQYGLAGERLAVKFNFRPGGTAFAADGNPYDQWVREIAAQTVRSSAPCISVDGHASRTGAERMNETVSLQRAEYVRQRMVTVNKALAKRVMSRGLGSRQVMVGIGRDDASDALDRRIEFKPAATCV